MIMTELMKLQIVCWNRGGNKLTKNKYSKNKNSFWESNAVGDPAIVFLQEEVQMIGIQGTSSAQQNYSLCNEKKSIMSFLRKKNLKKKQNR